MKDWYSNIIIWKSDLEMEMYLYTVKKNKSFYLINFEIYYNKPLQGMAPTECVPS